jgi:hypothetical protein
MKLPQNKEEYNRHLNSGLRNVRAWFKKRFQNTNHQLLVDQIFQLKQELAELRTRIEANRNEMGFQIGVIE